MEEASVFQASFRLNHAAMLPDGSLICAFDCGKFAISVMIDAGFDYTAEHSYSDHGRERRAYELDAASETDEWC
ncbi:MAG: hypothetical protein R3C49_04260 [Planctomycetaceae bacterium]